MFGHFTTLCMKGLIKIMSIELIPSLKQYWTTTILKLSKTDGVTMLKVVLLLFLLTLNIISWQNILLITREPCKQKHVHCHPQKHYITIVLTFIHHIALYEGTLKNTEFYFFYLLKSKRFFFSLSFVYQLHALCQPAFTCSKSTMHGSTKAQYWICSKLTTKTQKRRNWRCSDIFIVNFDQISYIDLVFPLPTWTSKWRRAIIYKQLLSHLK